MKKQHKVVLIGACIAGGATIAGAVVVSQGSDAGAKSSSDGDGDCRAVGQVRDMYCNQSPAPSKSASFEDPDNPAGATGPWRYRVVNTFVDGRDEGLLVRTCNVDDCPGPDSAARIGMMLQNHVVWVVCKEDSGFNGGESDGGTTWYKVKWPTNEPNTDIWESNREDRYTGWMFGKYLSAAGHDGKVAECADVA
ncbi:hypothetical protein AB0M28_31340 [Streptomyces sp. NPDC051940]|uniref:hypothetical protein n=1 Tax=Streptomyces sp. NPDC051940 TaxID=3155675 RepID=UPI003413B7D3